MPHTRQTARPKALAGPVAFWAVLLPSMAFAGNPSELTCDLAVDVPITVASLALALGLGVAGNKPASTETAATPSGIDTWAPQHRHPIYGAPNALIVVGSMAAGLLVPPLAAEDGKKWRHVLLYAEAFAITAAVTDLAKTTVRRPRPYTRMEPTGDADDYRSFFSADVATTAAVLFFAVRDLDITHDLSGRGRLSLYLGASALTAAVAALRVAEGKHYPSDVIVGAIVGASIGMLVPELHRRQSVAVSMAPLPEGGTTLSLMSQF
jgi:membrane-associated phospholipid phosphatase